MNHLFKIKTNSILIALLVLNNGNAAASNSENRSGAGESNLQAPKTLIRLQVPSGISLPSDNDKNAIPAKPPEGNEVCQLQCDIRLPIQAMAMLSGLFAFYQNKRAYLQSAVGSNKSSFL